MTKGLFTLMFCCFTLLLNAQHVSNTYSAGDIPTSFGDFNPDCTGPITPLTICLPEGGPWQVTGIDIEYKMEALGAGRKNQQRSQLFCQNTNNLESVVYEGHGYEIGIQEYSRTNVDIANGVFEGGTVLAIEMHSWRTTMGSGCLTTYNRVKNLSWTIVIYYEPYEPELSIERSAHLIVKD